MTKMETTSVLQKSRVTSPRESRVTNGALRSTPSRASWPDLRHWLRSDRRLFKLSRRVATGQRVLFGSAKTIAQRYVASRRGMLTIVAWKNLTKLLGQLPWQTQSDCLVGSSTRPNPPGLLM